MYQTLSWNLQSENSIRKTLQDPIYVIFEEDTQMVLYSVKCQRPDQFHANKARLGRLFIWVDKMLEVKV